MLKTPEMSRRQFNDLADIWLNSMPKDFAGLFWPILWNFEKFNFEMDMYA